MLRLSRLADWVHAKLAERDPIFVISHERSGTHLGLNILYRNLHISQDFFDFSIWLGPYAGNAARIKYWQSVINRSKTGGKKTGLFKSHVEADVFEAFFPKLPVVYVLRDPRDTLVSFFYYLNSAEFHAENPAAGSHYCASFADFLRRPLSNFLALGFSMAANSENVMDRWSSHVSGWARRRGVFVVRYEDMLKDYCAVVTAVSRFSGAWAKRRMQAFPFGESGTILPRKGKAGGWKTYFSADDESLLRESLEKHGVNLSYWDAGPDRSRLLLTDGSGRRTSRVK
jgi:hypothetical protein